jgi:hypothetical protein
VTAGLRGQMTPSFQQHPHPSIQLLHGQTTWTISTATEDLVVKVPLAPQVLTLLVYTTGTEGCGMA